MTSLTWLSLHDQSLPVAKRLPQLSKLGTELALQPRLVCLGQQAGV
jgi:hypothetical protein